METNIKGMIIMNDFLKQANSLPMYAIAVLIVTAVLIQALVFLRRAWKHGIAIGMDRAVLKKAAVSSAAFSIVPSIGILIGVLALAPALGVPVPWIRLSVIGALHYEGSTANNLAKGLGIGELPSSQMTGGYLSAIVLGMTVCILSGAVFTLIFFKSYQKRIAKRAKGNPKLSDILFSSMFIGMIAAYLGDAVSYLRTVQVSGQTRTPNVLPLIAFFTSMLAMALFRHLIDRKKISWLENYALSFSMLIGMACAVIGQFVFPSMSTFLE
jgi:hypothetical protein